MTTMADRPRTMRSSRSSRRPRYSHKERRQERTTSRFWPTVVVTLRVTSHQAKRDDPHGRRRPDQSARRVDFRLEYTAGRMIDFAVQTPCWRRAARDADITRSVMTTMGDCPRTMRSSRSSRRPRYSHKERRQERTASRFWPTVVVTLRVTSHQAKRDDPHGRRRPDQSARRVDFRLEYTPGGMIGFALQTPCWRRAARDATSRGA
jgi:hypothetical protein